MCNDIIIKKSRFINFQFTTNNGVVSTKKVHNVIAGVTQTQ